MKDASGVEDNRVAVGNQLIEIAELPVGDVAGRSIDDHEPTVTAALGGMLGDTVCGEVEVVVRCPRAVPGQRSFISVIGPRRLFYFAEDVGRKRPDLSSDGLNCLSRSRPSSTIISGKA